MKFKLSELPVYNYWESGNNEPPEKLKTKKQLSIIGLAPLKPVGVVITSKYEILLFDPENPESVRPKRKATPQQLENLKKGREKAAYEKWYRNGGFIECDRAEVVGWARELWKSDFVILDCESTGLGSAEIVEIAIIDKSGNPLINTLVKPTIDIPADAIAIHGITDDMVTNAPSFADIYERVRRLTADKQVAIYNDDADVRFLKHTCKVHKLPRLELDTICLMYWYSRWYGEWSSYYRDYKYQPLCGGHRALGDCLAALDVLKEMVNDSPEVKYP